MEKTFLENYMVEDVVEVAGKRIHVVDLLRLKFM